MRKILLNKCRSKTSVNETNVIPIEINRDASLFQDEHYITTVDTMQVYNDEKDTSKNHRIICTIKPLCSNVLFNNITEVVYKEGTTSCKNLTVTNAMNISGTISSGSFYIAENDVQQIGEQLKEIYKNLLMEEQEDDRY
jgi:hypothetical protein